MVYKDCKYRVLERMKEVGVVGYIMKGGILYTLRFGIRKLAGISETQILLDANYNKDQATMNRD